MTRAARAAALRASSRHLSQIMVLEVGDIVITGTPPGIALGMKPEPRKNTVHIQKGETSIL